MSAAANWIGDLSALVWRIAGLAAAVLALYLAIILLFAVLRK